VKLDRLRGLGPWFAFATPVLFLLSFVAFIAVTSSIHFNGKGQPPALPGWFDFGVATWLILMALFMVSGLLVAIDLEWIEHPRAHTGLTYLGLGAMVVSTLSFLILLIQVTFFAGWWTNVTGFLFFAGLGVYLAVMSWVGRRARLWGAGFSSLGIISGVFWVLVSFGVFGLLGGLAVLGLLPAVPLYLAWSIWLGFKLRGPAPQEAAPAA
jgi:hypothetical protein